ncbi:gamma-glutamyl-gamma-aminobutyrate hydrolase family protein [Peribacillus sp. SCS-37]|uniref:gamma-glutamyl-gamma-aminobutyrate hydrolase family protein n=1 Tax=Paraperibacillus esterisolvens TaxID=3115296 RepID=UPI0039062AA5
MSNHKPVIGITCSNFDFNGQNSSVLHYSYAKSVMKAGGVPVILPPADEETAREWADICDGILLSGGEDIDPQLFGEQPHPKLGRIIPERDDTEMAMLPLLREQKKPIFAICRGIQVLNAGLGGTVIQDIESDDRSVMKHHQDASTRAAATHSVTVERGSLLHDIVGKEELQVNSFHHQAVRDEAPGLKVSASAQDGIVEALESEDKEGGWMLAVQWHPEDMTETSDDMLALFKAFVDACRR